MLPPGHPYEKLLERVAKPGRYTGGEHQEVRKDPGALRCRVALAYPDVYEVGMSHLGLKILYSLVNAREDLAAERVYAPWPDMEAELRGAGLPLVSLETATPLSDFDVLGVSLQYELTATNLLTLLDLGGIPLRAADRGDGDPLVAAGGPMAFEAEPLAPFVDVFVIGDGEEALVDLMDHWARLGERGLPRAERLRRLAAGRGRYVPSLYRAAPDPATGLHVVLKPADPDLPFPVKRALVESLDAWPFPTDTPVAESRAVFDRHAIELARGCQAGCRFCQAGMIYRPLRERPPAQVAGTVLRGVREAGYDEVSLSSLSTADYSALLPLVERLMPELEDERVSLSVSSLRAYGLAEALLDEMAKVRATSLTFAPEAGSQRLRDAINKNVSDEQLIESARRAFQRGWNHIKLYFMIGLPGETGADLAGIIDLAARCRDTARDLPGRRRPARVIVSVSNFVPKPHTPFQWAAMDPPERLRAKQSRLRRLARERGLDIKLHDAAASRLEGILSRGDRRLADVIELAWRRGARFDGWDDQFRPDIWEGALADAGVDPAPMLGALPLDSRLPWEHLHPGVTRTFLHREWERGLAGLTTAPCGLAPVDPAGADGAPGAEDVCHHCGLACDLEELAARRRAAHAELAALAAAPRAAATEPRRYRLVYARYGPASSLGHLDLLRLWPRVLRRAGLRVAYSRGYHPHPRLSFSPALPTGAWSVGEQMEVVLREDLPPADLLARLAGALPPGLRLLEAHAGEARPLAKRLAAQRVLVAFAGPPGGDLAAACAALLARATITVTRERKQGVRALDVRPTLLALRPAAPEDLPAAAALLPGDDWAGGLPARVHLELALQRASVKPAELALLLGGEAGTVRVLRLGFALEKEP
ncbi:MAG: TIGR03960 family B12-binding radical SAM protein [Candidatus Krumholzibacteriota bacterium]|nr:TIGR03960 family B12-binding radical SAM protein [Candidatus Krumholzibacteriota bacterium]